MKSTLELSLATLLCSLILFSCPGSSGKSAKSWGGNQAPVIVSTTPGDVSFGYAVTANISVQFSEDMIPSTINDTTFIIKKGAAPIAGTVTYANKIAVFDPDTDLDNLTYYTVTILKTASGGSGTGLSSDYQFGFTTVDYATVPSPAFNAVAGTYDSSQTVAITCSLSGVTIRYTTDNTDPVTSGTALTGTSVNIA